MNLPQTPTFSLANKNALVVGASSGIGLACAVALADYGAKVTLAARRTKNIKELAEKLNDRGCDASILDLDISNLENIEQNLLSKGPYDVLVNSAGVAKHSLSKNTKVSDFDEVLNVNLKGAFFLTRTVANQLLKDKKSGSLINISSQMGIVGGLERSVYCASKHAVEGFTKAMAIEYGPFGIRINTICPTFILTDLTRPTFENAKKRKWIEEKIKLGRVGKVEDIMGAVIYLASDASSLVTGSALMVDGGWTAE
jgi:NAD(P)-dependent dehydrogenase (short-subunit alcohol dehydrogenase family)|tara:strand:- start:3675 stop:4439 length:765 start_codon:yes stop_codon:yes gene_type:complete